jgi:PAS domain-containing protein
MSAVLAHARRDDAVVQAWQAMLLACPDAAWVVALPSLRIVAVNPAALSLLGMDEATLRATRADHLLATPEDCSFGARSSLWPSPMPRHRRTAW